MQNLIIPITPITPELLAADKALRRAAANVKKQAEQRGTPYVVYNNSSNGSLSDKNQTNAKVK